MCYVVVQLRNKLRVVPLSLISLCMTRKETSQQQQKKDGYTTSWGQEAREMSAFQPYDF